MIPLNAVKSYVLNAIRWDIRLTSAKRLTLSSVFSVDRLDIYKYGVLKFGMLIMCSMKRVKVRKK